MKLPREIEIYYCTPCNFLFQAGGIQSDYDAYYTAVATDTDHREVSGGELRSPVAKIQTTSLVEALGEFFSTHKKVLDFGCGEAALLVELASNFSSSDFWGFDPGPGSYIGQEKARLLNLNNISIAGLDIITRHAPYDFIILSQVIEHFIEFDALSLLYTLLADEGILYIEVPDSLRYETHQKREFLYYFHRLHVNHFTPQSLARVAAKFDFAHIKHFAYAYPFKDGEEMPVMGMLLRKGRGATDIVSPNIRDMANRYIEKEKIRAQSVAAQFKDFDQVLVWGAGDNFYRSTQNGGPLSYINEMIILDQHPHELSVRSKIYKTENPLETIQKYPYPVIIAISEDSQAIAQQILDINPSRQIFFV